MKVLQIVAYGGPGGGTNHVTQLLTSLGAGYDNVLLTQQDSYLFKKAQSCGIPVVGGNFFRSRIDPTVFRTVASTVQLVQPNLIHCHGGRAAFFQSIPSTKIPSVYTVHGFHHDRKPMIHRALGWAAEYWAIRRKNNILFVADHDHELAVRQKLLPPDKMYRVIHNGIQPLEPKPTTEQIGVGFVGRFAYQKNPQLFLDIVDQLPDVKFVMVGGGELEREIRDEVGKRGIDDRVEFLGTLDHESTLDVISKLDMLVMTSRWEGLPLLLLEAMFMKVPVVSTNVGGIPEVIKHGETGMLSKSEDARELAALVQSLLDDAKLRDSIVHKAYQDANERFSQENMLSHIRESYQQVVQSAPVLKPSLIGRLWPTPKSLVVQEEPNP